MVVCSPRTPRGSGGNSPTTNARHSIGQRGAVSCPRPLVTPLPLRQGRGAETTLLNPARHRRQPSSTPVSSGVSNHGIERKRTDSAQESETQGSVVERVSCTSSQEAHDGSTPRSRLHRERVVQAASASPRWKTPSPRPGTPTRTLASADFLKTPGPREQGHVLRSRLSSRDQSARGAGPAELEVEGGSRSPSIRLRKNTDLTQASDKLGFVVASISGASADRQDGAHTPRSRHLERGSPRSTTPPSRSARSGLMDEPCDHSHGRANIEVCIRVRPATSNASTCVLTPGRDTVVLHVPVSSESERGERADRILEAKFDHVLDCDSTQSSVYEQLGRRVVDGILDGFNGCVIAYGQTGSGKSHSVFGGEHEDRGLLPRIAEGLFQELQASECEHIVKVSYIEIYNEKVRDLLNPAATSGSGGMSLEIRRHPKVGVFVTGLTQNVAEGVEDVMRLLEFGHKIRVVGATNMNAVSSRSHAVVTLHVEQTVTDSRGVTRLRRAQLHAVDLAGSERMENSAIGEVRRKESNQINKSLLALSCTIAKLAEQERSGTNGDHVPYRNSKLTYLLSNALMGNCRTVLLACISPLSKSLCMSESTVRFASSAKKVRTLPMKNEEVDGNLVSSLRAEIDHLRHQLSEIGAEQKREAVIERMATAQLLHSQFSSTREELQAQSLVCASRRQQVLDNLGLSNGRLASAVASEAVLLRGDADPYLVNICDDPLLSGCLMYALPRGKVVSMGSSATCTIRIDGLGIQPETCSVVCHDGFTVELIVRCDITKSSGRRSSGSSGSGSSLLTKWRARAGRRGSVFKNSVTQVLVNNAIVERVSKLQNKDRLRIGRSHLFQLFIPQDQSAPQDTRMTRLVDEISLESYGGQLLAKEYAAHLKERIGGERAIAVFTILQEIKPLVDEANDLTDELRGGEEHELVFKAHVLTDVTSVDKDPEIMLALHSIERPDEIAEDGTCLFQLDNPEGAVSHGTDSLAAVWSVQQFRERLDVLREVYQEVKERDEPWGHPGDLDPWQDRASIHRVQSADTVRAPDVTDETDGKSALATQLSAVEAEQQRMHCELVQQLNAIGAELQQTRAEREALMDHIPNLEMELGQAHARIAATDTTCQKLQATRKNSH